MILLTQHNNAISTVTHGDYKAAFSVAVTDLIAQDITDRVERIAAIKVLTEAYVDSNGESPDSAELERLSDYILREELTDPNPHKIAHSEYPFMSDRQLDLRRNRETSLKAAEETGADGRDYRTPTKRKRTRYENWSVDNHAKIRNKDRAAQYKRDTTPSKINSYNLRDTGGEFTPEFVQCIGLSERFVPAYV